MNEYDQNPYENPRTTSAHELTAYERDARMWGMLLHLSVLAGFVIPIAGWVAPIIIWQVKKDELPEIDEHGKIVVNWMISGLIYGFLCFLLIFVLIGIPLMIMLGILCTVYPIIGGIKANNGEYWPYPGSLRFF